MFFSLFCSIRCEPHHARRSSTDFRSGLNTPHGLLLLLLGREPQLLSQLLLVAREVARCELARPASPVDFTALFSLLTPAGSAENRPRPLALFLLRPRRQSPSSAHRGIKSQSRGPCRLPCTCSSCSRWSCSAPRGRSNVVQIGRFLARPPIAE